MDEADEWARYLAEDEADRLLDEADDLSPFVIRPPRSLGDLTEEARKGGQALAALVKIVDDARAQQIEVVRAMRTLGATWAAIAWCLGVTPWAAAQRYGTYTPGWTGPATELRLELERAAATLVGAEDRPRCAVADCDQGVVGVGDDDRLLCLDHTVLPTAALPRSQGSAGCQLNRDESV